MIRSLFVAAFLLAVVVSQTQLSAADFACCPAPHSGQTVLNADQTVIIMWDPISKIEHFIRKASFKSDGSDFGFLIPTPSQPELDESGNEAFPFLAKLTEPEIIIKRQWQLHGLGCDEDDMKKSAQMRPTTT